MDDTKRIISKQILVDTADAIRNKKGTSNTITPSDFADEIASIETQKPTQSKTVTPSTSQQLIEPDGGYELSSVTVNAVTSSIDSNIKPQNIAKNVSILGVNGAYESIKCSITTVNCTLPENIQRAIAAVVQGVVYIFGGFRDGYDYEVNHILKYDINSNTSSIVQATLPILDGEHMASLDNAVVVGTNIYLFIYSVSGNKTVYLFDTITETISAYSKELPINIGSMKVAVSEGYIYVIQYSQTLANRKIYVLGPENGENTYFKSYDTYLYNIHSMQVVGHTMYLFSDGDYNKRCYKIDIPLNSTRITTTYTSTNITFRSMSAQNIYFAGANLRIGSSAYSSANVITIACPQANFCKYVTIDTALCDCATVVYGNYIYCFGGSLSSYTPHSNLIRCIQLYTE